MCLFKQKCFNLDCAISFLPRAFLARVTILRDCSQSSFNLTFEDINAFSLP